MRARIGKTIIREYDKINSHNIVRFFIAIRETYPIGVRDRNNQMTADRYWMRIADRHECEPRNRDRYRCAHASDHSESAYYPRQRGLSPDGAGKRVGVHAEYSASLVDTLQPQSESDRKVVESDE